jgi:hypothetical protein
LKQKLGKKRIYLNNAQRRRRAIKGKVLGRKTLREIGSLFTPDTILRVYRELVALKWDYCSEQKRPGRPSTGEEIISLVIQIAQENLTADTRLWAALQSISGGTWCGCVFDVETIVELLGYPSPLGGGKRNASKE